MEDIKNTESSENTENYDWDDVWILVGAMLMGLALLVLIAIDPLGRSEGLYYDHEKYEQERREGFEASNRELLEQFEVEAWSEIHEDTPRALDDGSPGMERCYYTLVPSPLIDQAEENISVFPGYFEEEFSPRAQKISCEILPYDPVTGKIG